MSAYQNDFFNQRENKENRLLAYPYLMTLEI